MESDQAAEAAPLASNFEIGRGGFQNVVPQGTIASSFSNGLQTTYFAGHGPEQTPAGNSESGLTTDNPESYGGHFFISSQLQKMSHQMNERHNPSLFVDNPVAAKTSILQKETAHWDTLFANSGRYNGLMLPQPATRQQMREMLAEAVDADNTQYNLFFDRQAMWQGAPYQQSIADTVERAETKVRAPAQNRMRGFAHNKFAPPLLFPPKLTAAGPPRSGLTSLYADNTSTILKISEQ